MRVVAHRGNRLHAPENSRIALLSAYTAGADVLEFDVQLTADGYLVVSHDGTTDRMTGTSGDITKMTLTDLRALDFSETFRVRGAPEAFKYYRGKRPLEIQTLPELLDLLPAGVPKLIELKHDSSAEAARRKPFVEKTIDALRTRAMLNEVVLYSKDPENLRLARQLAPTLRIAAFDWELTPEQQLDLVAQLDADGLVTDLSTVLGDDGSLTKIGESLRALFDAGKLRVGAVLYPFKSGMPGTFSPAEYEALRQHAFVWSVSTDSMLDVASIVRPGFRWITESFAGTETNTRRWALGYAKANPYGHVFQHDGIHVDIKPYDGPTDPPGTPGTLEGRVADLERGLMYAGRDWPYYSGGGVGLIQGIADDFVADVSYTVRTTAQATTLEMAVVNVDPGAHQPAWNADGTPRVPGSFRDKDSFYDPHGAPPYVGVEHDEDDGYRINWNLGSEYDSNQYGRPVGDGKTPRAARLRLERRGQYFSAYYRNDVDAPDWVCVGAIRNDSMNAQVFLRCVGKRWRQESETGSGFLPIIDNEFVFKDLQITRFPVAPNAPRSREVNTQ